MRTKEILKPFNKSEQNKLERSIINKVVIGDKFGDYEVVEITKWLYKVKTKRNLLVYKPIIKVKCLLCGIEEYVLEEKILKYGENWKCVHIRHERKNSCVKYHVGQKIDNLIIKDFIKIHDITQNTRNSFAICDCECGFKNLCYDIRKFTDKKIKKHCGCKSFENRKDGIKQVYIIGDIINDWEIVEEIASTGKGKIYKFKCICCDEKKECDTAQIAKFLCKKRKEERFNYIQEMKAKLISSSVPENVPNLIGKQYGTLEIIDFSFYVDNKNFNKNRYWLVKCNICGKTSCKKESHLIYKETISDGCVNSVGELKITNFLIGHNINFIPQKTFEGCNYINPLRFDFYIEHPKTKEWFALEYQGKQHTEITGFVKTTKENINITLEEKQQNHLKYSKERDKVKRNYCFINKIKLIEIDYSELGHLEKRLSEILEVPFDENKEKDYAKFFIIQQKAKETYKRQG